MEPPAQAHRDHRQFRDENTRLPVPVCVCVCVSVCHCVRAYMSVCLYVCEPVYVCV